MIDNAIAVYVLQHPDETDHARGSAIIAQLCLQNYHCWVAEDFSGHQGLRQLIDQHAKTTMLVYPAEHAVLLKEGGAAAETGLPFMPDRLLFIDASWRKAKKIWHSTPVLQTLNCIRLAPQQASRYRIRKVPEAGHLSTIESIARSLMWLEHDAQEYQPLLDIFDAMIERQIDYMGQQTYLNNYVNKHGQDDTEKNDK